MITNCLSRAISVALVSLAVLLLQGCSQKIKPGQIDLFPKDIALVEDYPGVYELHMVWGFMSQDSPLYEFEVAVDIDGRPVHTGRIKVNAKGRSGNCKGESNCSSKTCPKIEITYNIFGEEDQWEWDGGCVSFREEFNDPTLDEECYCWYTSKSDCRYIASIGKPEGSVLTVHIDSKNEVLEISEENNVIRLSLEKASK